MTRSRLSYVFVAVLFLIIGTRNRVRSSSPQYPPTASPSLLPSTSSNAGVEKSSLATTSSASASSNDESSRKPPPRPQPKSSSVTFLYELYEHEMYNPKTDSWTDRRFTQSPTTGGGGRDSTSLDPQSCAPPRNYLFDGEWKIDMASASRDGFGWEYYVGKYDGLGRRRRRWVRSLRRVSIVSSAAKRAAASSANNRRPVDAKKTKKATAAPSSTKKARTQTHQTGVMRSFRDQYNFKGFGWSFYKPLLVARAVGAAFRIPISANFDSYDKFLAAPYISTSTYFGYPWVIATFFNASVPMEAIKWLIGGVIWKIQWGLAIVSAFIRGVVEHFVWIMLSPLRLWRRTLQVMGVLASKGGAKKEKDSTTSSLAGSIGDIVDGNITNSVIDTGDGTHVTIETHIAINNSSKYKDNEDVSALTATTVIESPRGGASGTQKKTKKKHLTISGNEIPTFHRTTSLEYSSTIQERIGMCVSWRISKERGYEYRWHFVYTCLPTFLFWGQLEEERKRRVGGVQQFIGSVWGKRHDPSSAKHVGTIEVDKIQDTEASRSDSKSHSSSRSKKSQSKPAFLSSFLSEHSSTVGMSSGFPLPVDPYFSLNLMMSLSGFFYGWLLKYIRSLFVLPNSKRLQHKPKDKDAMDSSTDSDSLKATSEKLVSLALKKKRLSVGEKSAKPIKSDGDEAISLASNTQIDVANDSEINTKDVGIDVAGL